MITWKTPMKVVKTAGGGKSNQLSNHKDDHLVVVDVVGLARFAPETRKKGTA